MPTVDLGPCACCGGGGGGGGGVCGCGSGGVGECFALISSFDFEFRSEPTGPAPPEIENNPNYCLERCDVTFTGSVTIEAWNSALPNPWANLNYYGDRIYDQAAFSTTCSSPDVQWRGYARVGLTCGGPGPCVRIDTSWIYANRQYCPNGSAGPMGGYDNSINGGMAFVVSYSGGDNEFLASPCDVIGVEQTLEFYEYAPAIYNHTPHMARKTLTFMWNGLP